MKYSYIFLSLWMLVAVTYTGGASAQEAVCLDADGDGYGWDGSETCTPIPDEGVCLDTDPVGDGWGWDGSTSCRVIPQNNSTDELAIIASNVKPAVDGSFATVYCPALPSGLPEETTYLYYSGVLLEGGVRGIWATGVDANDGWLRLLQSTGAFWRLYIQGNTVQQERQGELYQCEWL